tara:strand:- start:1266 stop:1493 length:228 start_codon:yes stop_codon:yes gene_type:complete
LTKGFALGNILVISVGKDIWLLYSLNKAGNTLSLEDIRRWIKFSIKSSPEINVLNVSYSTPRKNCRKLLENDYLL